MVQTANGGYRNQPTFTTNDLPGIECPERNCVVFGSTKKFKNHKGNLDFREMVRSMVLKQDEEIKAEHSFATTTTAYKQLSDNVKAPSRLKQPALLIDKVIEVASKEFIFR